MNRFWKLALGVLAAMVWISASANAFVDFFRAVNVDNAGLVKQLLARGFDPNAANDYGQVALYLAIRDEAPRVAEALLAHPQTKVDIANSSGETPLMMAALKGSAEWTQRLIERGAQVNRSGWTPLHYAASGGDSTPVVALLLERGAQIDARAPNGNTALMMAARYGAWDSADLLLARGADPRLTNSAGLAAADFARQQGRESLASKLERVSR